MHYFICEYCGNYKKSFFKYKFRPKCGCKGGNGPTFMTRQAKAAFNSWIKNKKAMKKQGKINE